MARAASGSSRSVASAVGAFAGLTSTATRTAFGTSSCRRLNRLATISLTKKLMPVALPPGLGKTADQTNLNWVLADAEDDRDCRGRRFSRERSGGTAGRGDDGYAAADKISQERGQAIVAARQPVVLDRHVLPLDGAGFLKAFTK